MKKRKFNLNSEGRERVQAEKVRKKTAMVTHYLMRNDLFIIKGRPSTWENEVKIELPGTKTSIIADAAYMFNKIHYFVEVDYKQSMRKNAAKIKRYQQLSTINPQFKLVWVTTTPFRKKKIEKLCEGLEVKVYLWEELR